MTRDSSSENTARKTFDESVAKLLAMIGMAAGATFWVSNTITTTNETTRTWAEASFATKEANAFTVSKLATTDASVHELRTDIKTELLRLNDSIAKTNDIAREAISKLPRSLAREVP